MGEKLDLSVGFTQIAPLGAALDGERPLAVVHAATAAAADAAAENLIAACRFSAETPGSRPVIYEILEGNT